jgi:hypothetical protein
LKVQEFDYLYIEGTGDLTTVDYNGDSVTITVPDTFYYVCGGTQVTRATTTATGITAYRYSQNF